MMMGQRVSRVPNMGSAPQVSDFAADPADAAALIAVDVSADDLLALHAADACRYPVLLQSTAANPQIGRFDILMAFPGERLRLMADGGLYGRAREQTFLQSLDTWCRQESLAPVSASVAASLPFRGGWFLYLGYELMREIEPRLRSALPASGVVAEAVRIPAAIVRCCATGQAWIVAEPGYSHLAQRLLADNKNRPALRPFGPVIEGAVVEEAPEHFLSAVEVALEHIRAGDIYQANLSRPWQARLSKAARPHDVYRRLSRANAAPFAAIARLDHCTIVSSSPERLIEIRDGMISTRPIAGTRPRSANADLDLSLARQLCADPKERAEHTMLIDLERNDLGRVCEAGTVEVDELMTVESYAHVHHIVSNVRGKLRAGVTPGQAIAAVFPGGTITGCPKLRCMEIIGALEATPRHAYTGSIGYLNRDGTLDLNILIRTLQIRGTQISFRAGAGIVADSDPRRELAETRAKARGLVAALTGEHVYPF
jgi:anthranilate synthase component 1